MSSCEEWPRSLGELRAVEQPVARSALRQHHRLEPLDAAPDLHQARHVVLDELSVATTLATRWPVRSWKLQASKICTTRSWMSCASPCSCSLLSAADSVFAVWSMSSAALQDRSASPARCR